VVFLPGIVIGETLPSRPVAMKRQPRGRPLHFNA